MSPLVAFWIASIVGALLFFIAGFLARRPAAGPRTADDALPREPPTSELEQSVNRLHNERDALQTVARELESQLKARIAAHEQVELRVAELENQLADLARADSPEEFDNERTRIRASTGEGLLEELMAESKSSNATDRDADVIATLLEILERQVGAEESWRSVALADDLSMPIVGAGEYKEPLAVFSGLIELIELRTRALLPISTLRRLTVEDTGGLIVSTCTLPDRSLSLVTLTHEETPSTAAMTELLEHTARML